MEKIIPSRPSYLYPTPGRVGLVLAGGAARGAYEVGVVQYIAEEIAKAIGRDPPLDIICGTSVGAINGCALAAYADYPRSRARRLVSAWRSLRIEDVLLFSSLHFMKFVRSAFGPQPTQAQVKEDRFGGLIDASGMERIIRHNIAFPRIEEHLRSGLLTGVTTSATHIATGNTVVFVGYGGEKLPRWSSDPKVVPRRSTSASPLSTLVGAAMSVARSGLPVTTTAAGASAVDWACSRPWPSVMAVAASQARRGAGREEWNMKGQPCRTRGGTERRDTGQHLRARRSAGRGPGGRRWRVALGLCGRAACQTGAECRLRLGLRWPRRRGRWLRARGRRRQVEAGRIGMARLVEQPAVGGVVVGIEQR